MVPSRKALLQSKLSELQELWVQPVCPGCQRRVSLPCQILALKHGRQIRLSELLLKLKCSSCGTRPNTVNASDAPIPPEHMIGEGVWVVPLSP